MHAVVAVSKLRQAPRAEQTAGDNHARIDAFARIGDHALFHQINQRVGNHAAVHTEIAMTGQRAAHRDRQGADAELDGGAVGYQRGGLRGNARVDVGGLRIRQQDFAGVAVREHVDVGGGDQRVL